MHTSTIKYTYRTPIKIVSRQTYLEGKWQNIQSIKTFAELICTIRDLLFYTLSTLLKTTSNVLVKEINFTGPNVAVCFSIVLRRTLFCISRRHTYSAEYGFVRGLADWRWILFRHFNVRRMIHKIIPSLTYPIIITIFFSMNPTFHI